MTDSSDPPTGEYDHVVSLKGPARFRVPVTDKELAAIETDTHPHSVISAEPIEWAPTGAPEDWDVQVVPNENTETSDDG
jgi:hypothetical protein